jgi:hypothetical protein
MLGDPSKDLFRCVRSDEHLQRAAESHPPADVRPECLGLPAAIWASCVGSVLRRLLVFRAPAREEAEPEQDSPRLMRREIGTIKTRYDTKDLLGRKPPAADDDEVVADRLRQEWCQCDLDLLAIEHESLARDDDRAGHVSILSSLICLCRSGPVWDDRGELLATESKQGSEVDVG